MATQCRDSETAQDEPTPIIISSGEQKPATTISESEITRTLSTQPIASALMQPLKVRPSNKVIAPSYTAMDSGHETPSEATRETDRSTDNEDGRTRGIAIHRMLQLLCERQSPAEIPRRIAAELAIAAHQHDIEQWFAEANSVFQAAELNWIFAEQEGHTCYNEVSVFYQHPQNDKTVLGIIDRLIETEDKVWIIDYKTHTTHDPEYLAELADRYREQIHLYCTGVHQLFPQKTITGGLLFTTSKKFIEVTE
jgi:ATP-dependent helicase/nuclease subunit A